MQLINVKKLKENATLPTRAHDEDAGLDLYASEDVKYIAGQVVVSVPTGVAIEVVDGYVGLVRDRSSVSKSGLKVTAGVVDAGYTGEVSIVMLNVSGKNGKINKGQKIAQMLVFAISTPRVREVTEFRPSARGDKGFGSSGT